jgi:hypothetical protein
LGKKRWEYRLEEISKADVDTMHKRLKEILTPPFPVGSGVDWRGVLKVVMNRYAERLELLQYLLRGKEVPEGSEPKMNWTAIAVEARAHLNGMINPYIVITDVPPPVANLHSDTDLSWANSVFQRCATTHTASFEKLFHSSFTQSEHLILNSVKATEKEICRVLVHAWAEGAQLELSWFDSRMEVVVKRWENEVAGLMEWLGWDVWTTCSPPCGYEVCVQSLVDMSPIVNSIHCGSFVTRKCAIFRLGRFSIPILLYLARHLRLRLKMIVPLL